MYRVTFRIDPGVYDEEFHDVNDAIQAIAEGMDEYLGKRTWTDTQSDEVLVVYYWESLAALETFGDHPIHKQAKQRWNEWYNAHEVTIAEVIDTYGQGFDESTGPP